MHPSAVTPMRDQDRPPYDGSVRRACLSALQEPASVADVAARLGWPYDRARAWVHRLVQLGDVARVDVDCCPTCGRFIARAGRYVVVTS